MKKIPTLFERRYENHRVVEVLEMTVKTSEWVTGAYVRAVMCRRE